MKGEVQMEEDVGSLLNSCLCVTVNQVRHSDNLVAHSLAKLSFEFNELRVWIEEAPPLSSDAVGGS